MMKTNAAEIHQLDLSFAEYNDLIIDSRFS